MSITTIVRRLLTRRSVRLRFRRDRRFRRRVIAVFVAAGAIAVPVKAEDGHRHTCWYHEAHIVTVCTDGHVEVL